MAAQKPEIQTRIRAAFDRLVSAYADHDGLSIPISFKVASDVMKVGFANIKGR